VGSTAAIAAFERFTDDVGDVLALPAELLRHRGVEATLDVTDVELVREAVGHGAVQGARAVAPVVVDRAAVAPRDHVDAPASLQVAGHLEAAGEDDAIHRVLDAAGDEAAGRDALDAPGVGHVDQLHMGWLKTG